MGSHNGYPKMISVHSPRGSVIRGRNSRNNAMPHQATKARALEYTLPLGLFIILVLFFYALHMAFYHNDYQTKAVVESQIKDFHWIDPTTDVNAATRELAGRYLVEAAYLLVLVASLAGAVHSLSLCVSLRKRLKRQHFLIIPALCLASFEVSYWVFVSSFDPFWTASLTGNLTEAASEHAKFGMFDQLSTWAAELTIVSQSLSGAAISTLIAVAPRNPTELREKISSQAILLYINALLLVVFAVSAACELLWAASLLPQDGSKEAYYVVRLAVAAALSSGIVNSLTMAGIHVPGIVTFARQAMGLADMELPDASLEEKQKFLARHGLSASPYEMVTKTVAILSPMIAGLPLTHLLTYFFS